MFKDITFKIKENKKILKFLSVGLLATLLDLILYYLFFNLLKINAGFAGALSFFISANFNFNLNNYFTFIKDSKKYFKRMVTFYIIAIFGLLLNIILINFLISNNIQYIFAKLIVVVIILFYNYLMHSRITFK